MIDPDSRYKVTGTFMYSFIIFSSPEHFVLKLNYCDRSMSVVCCQQFALKDYSSYTPRPIDLKLGKKYRGDL